MEDTYQRMDKPILGVDFELWDGEQSTRLNLFISIVKIKLGKEGLKDKSQTETHNSEQTLCQPSANTQTVNVNRSE